MKSMKAKLQIKEALKYYNETNNKTMTLKELGSLVLNDYSASETSKKTIFYMIANNHRKLINPDWLVKVAEITGYPPEKLIKYS